MSVPVYVALEKEPEERSSSLRRQVNKEREGNEIHVKGKWGGYWEERRGSALGKCGVSVGKGKEQSTYENFATNSIR